MWRGMLATVGLFALAACAGSAAMSAQGGDPGEDWVATWATALVAGPRPPQGDEAGPRQGGPPQPVLNVNNQTVRQIVRTSVGGGQVRVMLSNGFGTTPLEIGAASIALRQYEATIVPGSARVLTFGGRPTVSLAAGARVVSDPVALDVPALGDLAIDLYLPGDIASTTSPPPVHGRALQTNYVSPPGDHTGAPNMPVATTMQFWLVLGHVAVAAPDGIGAIAAIGSSTTDGSGSTQDGNQRWPDHLARRLVAQSVRMGVVNVGLAGNRLLTSTPASASLLERFGRDVLQQPGVTHVIFLPPRIDDADSPDELIAAHRELIRRAQERGLTVFAATAMPFEGHRLWTPRSEATRQAVNTWVRGTPEYDGVFDFDPVVRDPSRPTRLLPEYDSGDHLHPNDKGYQALANAMDLSMFSLGPN